jgi:hypothetical protein
MSFLIAVLRIVVILFVVRLILRGVAALVRSPKRDAAKARPRTEGVDLVRDRICNTFLPRERAIRWMTKGGEEYFCSEKCRKRAQERVARAS